MFIAIRLSKEISSVGATCRPSGAGFELHAWTYKHCVPTGLPESSGTATVSSPLPLALAARACNRPRRP